MMKKNYDEKTVQSFGDEWSRFSQDAMPDDEAFSIFTNYFSIFPLTEIHSNSQGFDMGCGSGRWAKFIAPSVGVLNCIDPSSAIEVAKTNLSKFTNVNYFKSSVGDNILPPESQDFGYSLGVLHHVPDTQQAICDCVRLLKPGAPFLVYLYYALDNKPLFFKFIWKISDLIRVVISRLPGAIKHPITDLIAVLIYYPLAKLSYFLKKVGFNVSSIPLSQYRNMSFYTMRTDSRDRFGTPLEQRFSRDKIESMMKFAGLSNITFSNNVPFWRAIGYKK